MRLGAAPTLHTWQEAWRDFRLTADGWLLGTLALTFFMIVPLLVVAWGLLQPAGEVWQHLASTLLPGYLLETLLLLVGTGVLAFLAGTTTAWLTAVYEFPGRRFFSWALILPLAIPTYIAAFAYSGLFDYAGPVAQLLRAAGHSGSLPFEIKSLPGAALVMGLVLYPYVYLIARVSFGRQSGALLEAAHMLGRSGFQVFYQVALPTARPALVGGLSLVLMETLNDYGAVSYYGVNSLTAGIFRAWFSMGDLDAALRLAACLMVLTLILLLGERLERRRVRYSENLSASSLNRRRLAGTPRWAATSVCMLPFAAGFVVPVCQLLWWTAQSGLRGFGGRLPALAFKTFLLAAGAALLTVVAALLITYTGRLHRGILTSSLQQLSLLGYSIPGAVIAVGVLTASVQVDGWISSLLQWSAGLLLTGSLGVLVYSYVVRFLAVAQTTTVGGFEKVCGSLDEASRSLGAGKWQTLWAVDLPLLRTTLVSAGLLVFVDLVKELPLTLILRPFNFDTLATKVFELAGDERVAQSASGALVIIATSLLPILLLQRLNGEGAR